MAQLLDHIDYLTREIGPRPAGTEEEQQAALYIADQLQHESGFRAEIEEFTSSSNLEGARAIPSVIIVVVCVLAIIFNAFTLPALILSVLAAAVYALEAFDRPVVSKLLARGASQNVVAKYQPEASLQEGKRAARRKIVLVAHYDTGKVKPSLLNTLENTGLPLGLIVMGAMAFSVLLLIVRMPVGGMGGPATIVLNVLSVIALLLVAAPIVKAVMYRLAPYNEGANNNASGTAALIEVARRISSGSVSEAELIDMGMPAGVVMHGEQAARESGLVPDDISMVYEDGVDHAGAEGANLREGAALDEGTAHQGDADVANGVEQDKLASGTPETPEPDEYRNEEERLLAAKAAIAALTGRPVESKLYVAEADLEQRASQDAAIVGAEGELAGLPAQDSARVHQDAEAALADAASPAVASGPVSAQATQAQPFGQVEEKAAEIPSPAETGGFQNAPDWFIAAQKNAKKAAGDVPQAQRSRYTQAIENAEREAAVREAQRLADEAMRREAEQRARNNAARAAMVAPRAQEDPQLQDGTAVDEASAQVAEIHAPLPKAGEEVEQTVLSPAIRVEEEERHESEPVVSNAAAPSQHEEPATQPVDLGQTTAYPPIHLQEQLHDEAQELQSVPTIDGEAANDLPEEATSKDEDKDAEAARPRNVLDALPQVAQSEESTPRNDNPSRSGMFRKLRADVPSLSGAIRAQSSDDAAPRNAAPSRSRGPLASSQIPAVSVEGAAESARAAKAADAVDYDMEVPIFDDSPIGHESSGVEAQPVLPAVGPTTETEDRDISGSVAASVAEDAQSPQVDMPKSRSKGLRNRLRRKKDDGGESMQEWLDVDENFDARAVGRERGSWESFRDDAASPGDGRTWQGGGFSRVHLDYVDMRSGENAESDMPDDLVKSEEDIILNEEIGQIIHFRNPQYNTEVWFVAIGSDTELHDGAKAFVEEHASELRGAMVIEVESLGAGVLAYASSEGQFRRVNASSRIKRYTRAATEATGIALDTVALRGADSAASTIQKAGYQAMHLLGVEDGKPALKGSADDVLENIDELMLEDNVNFLMELLKHN